LLWICANLLLNWRYRVFQFCCHVMPTISIQQFHWRWNDHSNGFRAFSDRNSNVFKDSAPGQCDFSHVITFRQSSFEIEISDSTPLWSFQQKSSHESRIYGLIVWNLKLKSWNDAKGSSQWVWMIFNKFFNQMIVISSLSAESNHSKDSGLRLWILSGISAFCCWTGNYRKSEYLICMNCLIDSGFTCVSLAFGCFLRSPLFKQFQSAFLHDYGTIFNLSLFGFDLDHGCLSCLRI
jgi:hypothetical protein